MQNISRLYTCKYLNQIRNYLPEYMNIFSDPQKDFPVFIKEKFLPSSTCDQIVSNLTQKEMHPAQVHHEKMNFIHNRVSRIIQLTDPDILLYENVFERIKPAIEDFYKVKFNGEHEGAHAIAYFPGGKYGLHADNSNPVFDEQKKFAGWQIEKTRRIISTILILTDSTNEIINENGGCTGGDLTFNIILDKNNQQPLRFKSCKGLFLAFPSHPCFAHQVHEVTGGLRASVVDWHFALRTN